MGTTAPESETAMRDPEPPPASLRCVVIGGSGQIGGWLLRGLAARGHRAFGTYSTVPMPGLSRLDASERAEAAAAIERQAPDVVFYPAGFTWVDGCERDPGQAVAANLEQPLNLAAAARRVGARFVYFSTDYVFDGRDGPYAEDAPTSPLSAYGRAKRDAELAIQDELGARQLTVRTSWVFGPERQGKNFAYQLLKGLAEGRPTVCPEDQVSSPSYGPDVAAAVVRLVEEGHHGLFHVAGPEVMDRVAFARAIARGFGMDPGLIEGRPTAELGQGAPRPLRGGLLTPRLDAIAPGMMRPLDEALDDFRRRLRDPGLRDWVRPVAGFSPPAGPDGAASGHDGG
ncbi:MAG: SDR family oxidoreductase [Isosphaeraceae bacterium]